VAGGNSRRQGAIPGGRGQIPAVGEGGRRQRGDQATGVEGGQARRDQTVTWCQGRWTLGPGVEGGQARSRTGRPGSDLVAVSRTARQGRGRAEEVAIWSRTRRWGGQVDRDGRPSGSR
jgi:hypothetical protein